MTVFKGKDDPQSRPVLILIGCKIAQKESREGDLLLNSLTTTSDHQMSLVCLTLDMNVRWLIKLYDFGPDTRIGGINRDSDEPKIGFGDQSEFSVFSLEKREMERV